jgi:hypothetical protein
MAPNWISSEVAKDLEWFKEIPVYAELFDRYWLTRLRRLGIFGLLSTSAMPIKVLSIFEFKAKRRYHRWRYYLFWPAVSLVFLVLLMPHIIPARGDQCFAIDGHIFEGPIRVTTVCQTSTVTGGFAKVLKEASRGILLLTPDSAQLFSSLGFIIAIAFALHQWSVNRGHSSLSDAFSRKAVMNQAIMSEPVVLGKFIAPARATGGSVSEPKGLESDVKADIFIFMEMDNLEYVFEKYRDGEITPRQALRQCFIFASRCGVSEFRDKAVRYSAGGFYRPEFRASVIKIASFSALGYMKDLIPDDAAKS